LSMCTILQSLESSLSNNLPQFPIKLHRVLFDVILATCTCIGIEDVDRPNALVYIIRWMLNSLEDIIMAGPSLDNPSPLLIVGDFLSWLTKEVLNKALTVTLLAHHKDIVWTLRKLYYSAQLNPDRDRILPCLNAVFCCFIAAIKSNEQLIQHLGICQPALALDPVNDLASIIPSPRARVILNKKQLKVHMILSLWIRSVWDSSTDVKLVLKRLLSVM